MKLIWLWIQKIASLHWRKTGLSNKEKTLHKKGFSFESMNLRVDLTYHKPRSPISLICMYFLRIRTVVLSLCLQIVENRCPQTTQRAFIRIVFAQRNVKVEDNWKIVPLKLNKVIKGLYWLLICDWNLYNLSNKSANIETVTRCRDSRSAKSGGKKEGW